MSEAALEIRGVQQRFAQAGGTWLEVIRNADLALARGEMVALVGPSGSGKSTLLHVVGLLERQVAGEVLVGGSATSEMSDDGRTKLRREAMGFVYQHHHLLPEFSAQENVTLPLMIAGERKPPARARAKELLERVGLGDRLSHRPAKLSGGEQQRVAIARALANRPRILLADEPTGNLDVHTSQSVFELLAGLARRDGVASLIATHNLEIAARMDRVVTLRDGVLCDVKR
jgi:lipoprotein-releasing system ATP-binding protein